LKGFIKYIGKIKSFSYAFGFQVSERIFYFIFFLVLARTFSVAEYGEIVLIFTVHNILLAVFNFGLPVLIQKSISSDRNGAGRQIIYFLFLNLLISVLYLSSSAILYLSFFGNINTVLYAAISLSICVSSFFNLNVSANYGLLRLKHQFYLVSAIRTVTIAVIIFLVFCQIKEVSLFIALLGISNLISWTLLLKDIRNEFPKGGGETLQRKELKAILKATYPLALISVINFLYTKIDVVLISYFLTLEDISYYNVGYGVFTAAQLFFGFILTGGFSEVSSYNRNMKAVKLFLIKYVKLITAISLSLAVILFIAGSVIINSVWGIRYSGSGEVLSLLAFALIPLSINNLTGIILNGLDMFKQNLAAISLGLAVNIILNIFLINSIGIKGAVIATIITEIVILTADLYFLIPFIFKKEVR